MRSSARKVLDSLDKTWPQTEAAQALVPRLIAGLMAIADVSSCSDFWYDYGDTLALLDRIDPRWTISSLAQKGARELEAILLAPGHINSVPALRRLLDPPAGGHSRLEPPGPLRRRHLHPALQ